MTNKIYFLKPSSDVDHNALNELKKIIDNDRSLNCCVSYFTSMDIADELIERTKNEKLTQIIFNSSDVLRPYHDGTEICVSAALLKLLEYLDNDTEKILKIKFLGRDSKKSHTYTTMHHKFMVTDNIVAFGSLNYTENSFRNNYENLVISDNDVFVKKFKIEFDELWSIAEEYGIDKGKIRCINCPNCNEEGMIDFESYGAICTNCHHKFYKTPY